LQVLFETCQMPNPLSHIDLHYRVWLHILKSLLKYSFLFLKNYFNIFLNKKKLQKSTKIPSIIPLHVGHLLSASMS